MIVHQRGYQFLRLSPYVLALAGLLLLGLAGYRYRIGLEERRLVLNLQIGDLRQMHTEWSRDLLLTKDGYYANYDRITMPLARTRDALQQLQDDIDKKGLEQMRTPLQQVRLALAQKAELVEEFKSENAILRNSLRYLPVVLHDLESHWRPLPHSGRQQALMQACTTLYQAVLNYQIQPGPEWRQQYAQASQQVLHAARQHAPPVQALADLLVSHAGIAMIQKSSEDRVQRALNALAVDERMDALEAASERVYEQGSRNGTLLRALVALYALALVGVVTRKVSHFNLHQKALRHAKEKLEQSVQQRTHELSLALDNLKESQSQLIQSAKMAVLGQMVAGVMHEVNTPLAYVKNNLQVVAGNVKQLQDLLQVSGALVQSVTDDTNPQDVQHHFAQLDALVGRLQQARVLDDTHDLLQDGVHGVAQIKEIVDELRNFSRMDRALIDNFDLNQGLASVLRIVRSRIAHRTIEQKLGQLPPISCSPSQINQVLLNLIQNAMQATDASRGVITLTTQAVQGGVQVQVRDNGCGMSPEVLQQVFDPFFTTKPVGKGTGLGLSIVQRIVLQHGGRIDASSAPGQGSTFTVFLPLHPPPGQGMIQLETLAPRSAPVPLAATQIAKSQKIAPEAATPPSLQGKRNG